jgi:HAD superfamily hydrolase (TIGR01509 family)
MQKKYVFDLDGTLVDSMPHWCKLTDFLTDRGIEYPPDLIKKIIALGLPGAAKYFKEHFPLTETVEEIYQSFIDRYIGFYETEIPAKDGVIETLFALKERGVSLNVLTASPHLFLDPCLKRLGIYDLFDNLWTVEDVGSKAESATYLEVAKRLGVNPEDCVLFDDSVAPLLPAKAAGWSAVGVYDDFSGRYEDEMRKIADGYIYNLKELL